MVTFSVSDKLTERPPAIRHIRVNKKKKTILFRARYYNYDFFFLSCIQSYPKTNGNKTDVSRLLRGFIEQL